MAEQTYTIREAARTLDVSEIFMRALVRSGRLPAQKEGDGPTAKWVIPQSSLDEYKATKGTRRTTEGKNGKAFTIHVPSAQNEKVREALAPFGIELELKVSNYSTEKAKAYRAKRAATKRAANAH